MAQDRGVAIQDRNALADVTNITFIQVGSGGTNTTLSVVDTNEVRLLLSEIEIQNKEPCACAHMNLAVFQKPGGEIRVSFCDHCFDVLADTNAPTGHARFYKMPKRFYSGYFKLVRAQTNQFWYEQES